MKYLRTADDLQLGGLLLVPGSIIVFCRRAVGDGVADVTHAE